MLMIKMGQRMFNIVGLKRAFEEKGIKAGKSVMKKFIQTEEKNINGKLELVARKARILGRKVTREEDLL